MSGDIEKIIKESTFKAEEERFAYAKVSEVSNAEKHFMVTRDSDEITVVTKEENLCSLNIKEKNKDFYKLIALNVSVPFYCVGFLASISAAMAGEGMDILIVSAYSKDYIMVKEDNLEKAVSVLSNLGLKELKQ